MSRYKSYQSECLLVYVHGTFGALTVFSNSFTCLSHSRIYMFASAGTDAHAACHYYTAVVVVTPLAS